MASRAWSFLAITGKRQYAGNEGYADTVSSTYRFDSTVGNSRHVRRGDLAVLRDRDGLLGIGTISSLQIQEGVSKQRNRCPVCNTTAIKKRAGISPSYRCDAGHEFDEPAPETILVTSYEAHYADSWIPLMRRPFPRSPEPGAARIRSVKSMASLSHTWYLAAIPKRTDFFLYSCRSSLRMRWRPLLKAVHHSRPLMFHLLRTQGSRSCVR